MDRLVQVRDGLSARNQYAVAKVCHVLAGKPTPIQRAVLL